MVQDLIAQIKLQAEDEHNDLIMQQAMGLIETLLESYAAAHPKALAENTKFVEYIKATTQSQYSDIIYQISDHALFQLNALLDGLLDQSKENTKLLLQKKYTLKKKLDEIESYLTLDINENVLSDLFGSIRQQEANLVDLEVKMSALQQQRGTINTNLISKTSEFNRAVEAYLQNAEFIDDTARMSKYSNLALRIVEEFTIELQRKKTGVLGKSITQCYKQLANKRNMIDCIIMDPDTLDIRYLDFEANEVPKDSLSAGEKQLMVIAILWALAICSKKKLPVIIDTPLSRLDSMHRSSLVTTYFPKASDQTIILSTDSEIDQNYYDMMKDFVGDEFTLEYSDEEKSTKILKGYFIQNGD